MTDLLLGIDSGQTVGKAALFTLDGHEVAVASAPTKVSSPRPRRAERDMEEVWQQLCVAIREVLDRAGASARIVGVGLCGHNDGLYAVDAQGCAVRPAILATDSRAHVESARLSHGEAGRRALALTGQVPSAASPASLLLWLRANEPDSFAATRWALFCKDWLRFRLTGEIATDPSEASAAFTDVHTHEWSTAALDLYDLADAAERLPRLRASTEVAGWITREAAELTGLTEGTPVVTGAHDVDAAALGIGATSPGSASIVLGTYSINQVLADRPAMDPRWQARSFVEPGRWLHMATSPAGAGCLDWAVRQMGPWTERGEPDAAGAVTEAAVAGGAAHGPLFLPFLHGSPHGQDVAGAWLALRGWHDRGHLLHAVMEGVVFNHCTHLDALREVFDIDKPVRVCGGGARSMHWTQMLADVSGLPLEVTDASEAGARGAALLAGVGIGVYPDVASAAESTVRVTRHHEPDEELSRMYDGRYRRYLAAVEAVRGLELDREDDEQDADREP